MTHLYDFIEAYYIELLALLSLVVLISLILLFTNFLRTSRIIKKYKRLMRGVDNKNLESLLYNHLDSIQNGLTRIKAIELELSSLSNLLDNCIQRVGIIRYNAFEKMGGDQSFSLALLDKNGKGVVITSLYGNTSSATFAKPVINYKSSFRLSPEEEEAIERAAKS